MKQNAIGWFDIYVNDMERAVAFYQTVLKQELENMGDPTDSNVIMKSFPTDMENYGAGGALVKIEYRYFKQQGLSCVNYFVRFGDN